MDKPSLTVESTSRVLQSSRDGLSSTLVAARTKRQTRALPVTEVFGVHEVASESVSSHAAQLVSSALSNQWKPSTCGRPR
jgi:hypothetical protein